MEWWNNIVAWFSSDAVANVFNVAVFPTLAVLVAGIVAALIGRGSTKRIVSLYQRDQLMAAVAGIIGSARRAARWNLLSATDQQHADTLALESEIRLRLLPVTGASMAADWAVHEIGDMKRNAISFSFQAEQSLIELRNRMLEWHEKPSRAKKLFKTDLDAWAYDATLNEESLIAQQQAWASEQVANNTRASAPAAAPVEAPAPTPTTDAAPPAAPTVSPTVASPTMASPTMASPTESASHEIPALHEPSESVPPTEPPLGDTVVTDVQGQRPVSANSVRQRLESSTDSPV